jgi:hypothetical protein
MDIDQAAISWMRFPSRRKLIQAKLFGKVSDDIEIGECGVRQLRVKLTKATQSSPESRFQLSPETSGRPHHSSDAAGLLDLLVAGDGPYDFD